MARVPRSRPLLCIDIAADTLHATFLPKGQGEPRLSGLLPATATPVELAQGELGWRVGAVAFARRLVDAHDTVEGVPGYVARQAAESVDSSEAWFEGSMPTVDEAVAKHESLSLPMAHLLAHVTRRALGEEEPAVSAGEADEADTEARDHDDDEQSLSETTQSESLEADAPSTDEDEVLLAEDDDASADEAPLSSRETQSAASTAPEEQSPTALALRDAETLLLVGGGVQAAAQQALADATQLAGLPAPSVMLRDEAIAVATWRLARAEAHAERVREQMAHEARLADNKSLVPQADNDAPRTEAEEAEAAHADGAEQHAQADSDAIDAVSEPADMQVDDVPNETYSAAPEEAADDIAGTADVVAPFQSQIADAPNAWWQMAIDADGFDVCRVEVSEDGPRVRQRARTSHASLQAVAGRAYAWACEAWDALDDASALDALAERRVIDGAKKVFRSLSQTDVDQEAPVATKLTLPALALRTGDSTDESGLSALLGLNIELKRTEALTMLEPLLALAMGTIDDIAPPAAAAPQKKGSAKRRKKDAVTRAADAEGVVMTGDIDAWPGLREALLSRFEHLRPMTAPSLDAVAHAGRSLLDGTDLAAA